MDLESKYESLDRIQDELTALTQKLPNWGETKLIRSLMAMTVYELDRVKNTLGSANTHQTHAAPRRVQ